MLRFAALLFFFALLATVSANVNANNRHSRLNSLRRQPTHSKISTPMANATWSIDASKPLVSVSPDLFGVFFEEINHAGHGGLYSQSIGNSNFEDARSIVYPWKGVGDVMLSIDKRVPVNAYNPHSLKVTAMSGGSGTVGVINPGFYGVNANVSVYHLSFWARSETIQSLNVALTSADGSKEYSTVGVTGISGEWKKHSVDMPVNPADDNKAQFEFTWTPTNGQDSVYFDVVTAFPGEGWNGLPNIRADLAQKMADLHPSFVRFPGGCYVEGDDLVNRFFWKNAIGPVEERAGHWDLWNYWSEDGLGMFEYLSLIEKMTDAYGNPTRSIWVINNGVSHGQSLTPEQVAPYVQDALDSLEFAMGSTDSEWGRIRAEMGHAAPFPIDYMAIGNEDCGKPYYAENYQLFYDAIAAKYPSIKKICNCDPNDKTIQGHPIQVWDFHTYQPADNLAAQAGTFDDPNWRKSGAKIFNSEYAVTGDSAGLGNLQAALAEAAWMTGLERNSDVVSTASYAPLFVNNDDRFWNPDAIVFDSERSFGTPSYWNQLIWANSFAGIVNGTVKTLTNSLTGTNNVFVAVSVGQLQAGGLVLVHKFVNRNGSPQPLTVSITGLPSTAKLNPVLDVVALAGTDPKGENSFEMPTAIAPVMSQITVPGATFDVTLPAYSVLVVRAYASVSKK